MKLNSMYSFFILVDTNDPLNFHIEMTKMNYRLRFSALKSNHIRKYGNGKPVEIKTHMCHDHPSNDECTHSMYPGYHNVLKSNYTFYLLHKQEMTSEEANEYKINLIDAFKSETKCKENCKDKFTVSF